MKKAQGLSTICISALAVAVAAPSLAQVPGAGACFTRSYDAAHLARNPQQGVAAMTAWVFDQVPGAADSRALALEVRLARQGQAAEAGLGGRSLRQILPCATKGPDAGRCFVECDGGFVTLAARGDGALDLITDRVMIGADMACAGMADLAEGGARTVYRLAPAFDGAACVDLATARDLPPPGCYGAEGLTGAVAALHMLVDPPLEWIPAVTFPFAEARMQLNFSSGDAGGALKTSAPVLWLGCSAFDGQCRHSDGTGTLTLTPEGAGLRVGSAGATLFAPEADAGAGDAFEVDITATLQGLPVLAALPMAACVELVLE